MYKNIFSYLKAQDYPDVESTIQDSYEELRRYLLDLSIPKSLYGPTIFDEDRRNVGRGSAASQWLVPADSSDNEFQMLLISPDTQATAAPVNRAPSSFACQAGSYINETLVSSSPALLESKCNTCPADSYQSSSNIDSSCMACSPGSSTDEETGAAICVEVDENLVSTGLITFSYAIVSLNFLLAIMFASWTIYFRKDPVVQIGQKEFLLLVCIGSIISSSSIIPLSFQAGIDEDTTAASRACATIPWLYATGWTLQYSSLFAKSFRMSQVVRNSRRMRRVKVTAKSTLIFVFGFLCLNWAIIIPWTILDPFRWERFSLGVTVEQTSAVITEESIGRCHSDHLGIWVGTIQSLHFIILAATNVIMWRIRHVDDRYQESKYVSLASLLATEFLLLGIPILIAVGDSSSLRYITIVFIIAFSDVMILLMVFVPKVLFQRQGLPENVSVVQSILRVGTPHSQTGVSRLPHSSTIQSGAGRTTRLSTIHSEDSTT